MYQTKPQKISKFNLFLLFVVVLLSMATLASDPGGWSPESIRPFESQGRKVQLTIHPSTEYIKDLDTFLPLSLQLVVENAFASSASKAQWTLSSSDDSDSLIKGGFQIMESWTDEGRKYSTLTTYTPPFCQDEQTNDCIPCNLVEGCTLELKVDVCEPSIYGYYFIARFVDGNRNQVEKDCNGDEDNDQCRRIEEWLTSEDEPLTEVLCLD